MKKLVVIICVIVIAITLVLSTMYVIDKNMMKNNKPVIFSTWGYDYAPPELTYEILDIEDKTKTGKLGAYSIASAVEKIMKMMKIYTILVVWRVNI